MSEAPSRRLYWCLVGLGLLLNLAIVYLAGSLLLTRKAAAPDPRRRIAVLFGGRSAEHEVSVVSAGSHAVPDPEYVEVNPTPPAEFFALGVNVTVAQPSGGHIRASGNSFAAPHITGMCARILGAHPEFGAPQLKMVLAAIANNVS